VEGVLIPTSHKLKKITEIVQSIFVLFARLVNLLQVADTYTRIHQSKTKAGKFTKSAT
jgi:hypothetical protein